MKRSKGNGGASGYCFIGKKEDLPDRYLDAEVIETFPHTVNYPGTAYRLDLVPTTKEKQGKWFYGEHGQKWKLPDDRQSVCADDAPWERLIIAIFEQAAGTFRYALQEALAESRVDSEEAFYMVLNGLMKKPRRPVGATELQIRRFLRKKERWIEMMQALDLLDTSAGSYIVQRIKDEELIKCIHPELELISDPKKKAEEADRLRAELVKERVKKERIKNDGRQQSNQNEDR
jgi:hypothetical protein